MRARVRGVPCPIVYGPDRATPSHLEVQPARGGLAAIEGRGQSPRCANRAIALTDVGDPHAGSLDERADSRATRTRMMVRIVIS